MVLFPGNIISSLKVADLFNNVHWFYCLQVRPVWITLASAHRDRSTKSINVVRAAIGWISYSPVIERL
jgi:hypothetical protein